MPELPEVEVTRRRIEPFVVGRRIRRVRATAPSTFFLTSPAVLRRRLPGRSVVTLSRRGKYLLAELDEGSRLVFHLGMTGQLFVAGASSPRLLSATARAALDPEEQSSFRPDRHTHLCLGFDDDGPDVLLRDVRKFGKVFLVERGKEHPRLSRLGPDALTIDGDTLFAMTRRRRGTIKSLLLDQSILAGGGNIYTDEALFLAGIRPRRAAGRVTRHECKLLALGLVAVMERSIETGGSSISDFVSPDGSDGGYQDERKVYAREGLPCDTCASPIRRVVIGGRSAHYCPACQH